MTIATDFPALPVLLSPLPLLLPSVAFPLGVLASGAVLVNEVMVVLEAVVLLLVVDVKVVVVLDTVVLVVVVDDVQTPHMAGQVDRANVPSSLSVSHCTLRMYVPQMLSSTSPWHEPSLYVVVVDVVAVVVVRETLVVVPVMLVVVEETEVVERVSLVVVLETLVVVEDTVVVVPVVVLRVSLLVVLE